MRRVSDDDDGNDPLSARQIISCVTTSVLLHSMLITIYIVNLIDLASQTSEIPFCRIQSLITTPINSKFHALNFNFTFSITNEFHSEKILYDFDSVSLSYDGAIIATTTLFPLSQTHGKQQSFVKSRFVVDPAAGVDGSVFDAILADRRQTGAVNVVVDVAATVTAGHSRHYDWPERKRSVRVRCKDVKIVFTSDSTSLGTLAETPTKCKSELDEAIVFLF